LTPIDADLPITLVYKLSDLVEKTQSPFPNVTITAKCDKNGDIVEKLSEKGPDGKKIHYYEGVLMPGQRNCEITAQRKVMVTSGPPDNPKEEEETRLEGRLQFVALDSAYHSQLSIPRRAFAKTTSIYTFDGGQLVKSETVRPSPVVSAVALPGKAIGGFLGGIVSGLTGKKDAAEAENARVDAEIKRVTKARELKALLKKPEADTDETTTDTSASQ
jgi:hypothetical protein